MAEEAVIWFNKFKTKLNKECKFSGCVMPECIGKPIKAHSIQRSGILSAIAEQGMVLYHEANPFTTVHDLKEIGIATASTFSGFCNKHDTSVFAPIEDHPYRSTARQDLLFAFRSCTKEYVAKKYQVCVFYKLMKIYPIWQNPYEVVRQDLSDLSKQILDFLPHLNSEDDSILERRNYQFNGESLIAVNSIFNLRWDFNGKEINKVFDRTVDIYPIYFNVFPQNGQTNVLLSYLKQAKDTYSNIFSKLDSVPEKKRELIFSQIIMNHCENFFLCPSKWRRLDLKIREAFWKGFMNTLILQKPGYLSQDPVVNLFELLR